MTPTPRSLAATAPAAEESEEEDYMTMVIPDALPPGRGGGVAGAGPETSLQRRQRLRREGEQRGRVKSRAELAAEEEAARERALGTSLLADPAVAGRSKGFAMMARMGFKGGALGRKGGEEEAGNEKGEGEGAGGAPANDGPRVEPIRISVKDDRGGIGLESEKKRKLREAAEAAEGQAKRVKADEGEYRERVRRERELARLERQVHGAQKIAERMDEEKESGIEVAESGKRRTVSSRPLKSISVLWRGLVRAREEAERDRRMRYDLEQSLSRLPTYEDEHEDEDDKRALGKSKTVFATAQDLDEEDPELDEFNALPPEERLQKLVDHLRKEHHYCFWCKFTYPDESMEGCPGTTEEDHD